MFLIDFFFHSEKARLARIEIYLLALSLPTPFSFALFAAAALGPLNHRGVIEWLAFDPIGRDFIATVRVVCLTCRPALLISYGSAVALITRAAAAAKRLIVVVHDRLPSRSLLTVVVVFVVVVFVVLSLLELGCRLLLFGWLLGCGGLRQAREVMLVCLQGHLLVLFMTAFDPVELGPLRLNVSRTRVLKHVKAPALGI